MFGRDFESALLLWARWVSLRSRFRGMCERVAEAERRRARRVAHGQDDNCARRHQNANVGLISRPRSLAEVRGRCAAPDSSITSKREHVLRATDEKWKRTCE
jgi:hypothetical protein